MYLSPDQFFHRSKGDGIAAIGNRLLSNRVFIPPVPLTNVAVFSPQSPRSGSPPGFSGGQFSQRRAAAENKMGLSELRPVVRDSDWMYWACQWSELTFKKK